MLTENLLNLKEKYKRLMLYGAGSYAQEILSSISKDLRNNIEKILVTHTINNPKELYGIPVVSIDSLEKDYKGAILIAVYDSTDIKNMLLERGFYNLIDVISDKYYEYRDKEIRQYSHFFHYPLFRYIEIETINRCNGTCSFCPVNCNAPQREYHKMSTELYYKIIDELAELRYKDKVALFSNNEPLLDDRFVEFAKYAREKLPYAYIYVYTNASLLTMELFKEVIPYLNRFHIDNYNYGKKIPILDKILSYCDHTGMQGKVTYMEIDKASVRSSRGGNAPNKKIKYTINHTCPLPFVQMVIRPDGKISLCCNDALGENTLGDVSKQSLVEIWESDIYKYYRKKY